jgi:hypothetical protein
MPMFNVLSTFSVTGVHRHDHIIAQDFTSNPMRKLMEYPCEGDGYHGSQDILKTIHRFFLLEIYFYIHRMRLQIARTA